MARRRRKRRGGLLWLAAAGGLGYLLWRMRDQEKKDQAVVSAQLKAESNAQAVQGYFTY